MGKLVRAFTAAGGPLLCMLVLSGCVQVNAAPLPRDAAPSPQTTATPRVDGGSYASVVELRDAMVNAGLDCPQWDRHDGMLDSMSAADCSENIVLATYSSKDDREKQMKRYRAMGESMEMTVLVGVNWTINSPLADRVQDKLGGYLYESTGKR
ncbi:hypothetical protein NCCP2145_23410 [Pseudarthrobacter sp. NCCP-2145]|nr:hypothetical protein NCCP2145_23410 [Pseudarthrobacter sp. NCCP-2145]